MKMTASNILTALAVLVAAAAALASYASITPAEWALLSVAAASAAALYALLGRLKGAGQKLSILIVYAFTAGVLFHATAGDIFRNDDWFIVMLFDTFDGVSLKTIRDVSFFEMFGHIRFQPLAHLLMLARYMLFGDALHLYHIVNMTLHVLTAFMLFMAVNAITKEARLSFLAGLLFLALPSQFDTVAWTYHVYIILGSLLALAALYMAARYTETRSVAYMAAAAFFCFVSLMLYEPALFVMASVVAVLLAILAARGERLPKRELYMILFMAAASYMAYSGLALYGFLETKARHTMSLSSMAGPKAAWGALKVVFSSLWLTFFKNTGLPPVVELEQILYLRPPEIFAGVSSVVKAAFGAALLLLIRIRRENRLIALALALTALSYLFIIALGRLVTNEPWYVPSQSRYLYLPNALFLISTVLLLWPRFRDGGSRRLVAAMLFGLFFWNAQATLSANREVVKAFEVDPHYHRVKEFLEANPGALLYIDLPQRPGENFVPGSDIALDFLFKGRSTRFPSRATHSYDGALFRPNPAPAAPSAELGDFRAEWRYVRDRRFGPKKEVDVVGSAAMLPRIAITPENFIKVELKNAVTNDIETFLMAVPKPPVAGVRNWVGAWIAVGKSGDELYLEFNGDTIAREPLKGPYGNWAADGIGLYGGYFKGAAESVYVEALKIRASAASAVNP